MVSRRNMYLFLVIFKITSPGGSDLGITIPYTIGHPRYLTCLFWNSALLPVPPWTFKILFASRANYSKKNVRNARRTKSIALFRISLVIKRCTICTYYNIELVRIHLFVSNKNKQKERNSKMEIVIVVYDLNLQMKTTPLIRCKCKIQKCQRIINTAFIVKSYSLLLFTFITNLNLLAITFSLKMNSLLTVNINFKLLNLKALPIAKQFKLPNSNRLTTYEKIIAHNVKIQYVQV